MKRSFTLFALLQMVVAAWAQQIPNSGFELWASPDHPDFWSTNATSLPYPGLDYFAVRDTFTYTEGHASMRLTTDTFSFQGNQVTYASQAGIGTGTFISGQGIYFSGIAYTARITSLRFSYKYIPAHPVDSGLMQFNLSDSNGASIFTHGALGWNIGSTSTHWDTALFLFDSTQYHLGRRPDTLKLVFYSSTSGHGLDPQAFGSTLWIDDIQITSPTTAVAEVGRLVRGVNVYPNPSTNLINITIEQNELGSEIQLSDLAGRMVYRSIANKENTQVYTGEWPEGTYTVSVKSTDRITTYQGKVNIAR